MSILPRSFIKISALSTDQINQLFQAAQRFSVMNPRDVLTSMPAKQARYGALVFFENSTRTRLSFEAALASLQIYPLVLDANSGSSLEKGESFEDTLLNVSAMKPEFIVVRCGDDLDLETVSAKIPTAIINAGWGKKGHPTQALLDLFTIREKFGTLDGLKLLIVGDVAHSRVASSHLELAEKFGYELAFAGPIDFLPKVTPPSVKIFSNLKQGLEWANVVMALRVQTERHNQTVGDQKNFSLSDYIRDFGINLKKLRDFSPSGLIMHPGPINWGVEFESEVQQDSRQVILKQVTNGVYIRQAVIEWSLGNEWLFGS